MIASGRAKRSDVWSANLLAPNWPRLASQLANVRAPDRKAPADEQVPTRLRHLFWNTAPAQLAVARNGSYIARRLLTTMDLEGLAWGASNLRRKDWLSAAQARMTEREPWLGTLRNRPMGRAEQERPGEPHDAQRQPSARLPRELRSVLPSDTARAWVELAPVLPEALYLGGGTALAVHLHHRESRDLDFFYHAHAVDLRALRRLLEGTGKFALTGEASGTLRGLYGSTKLEFFHADLTRPQTRLRDPRQIARLAVASVPDLAAMKIKVIGDHSELRDYFDLKLIEEQGGITVEEGLGYFLRRFNVTREHGSVKHIVEALGYLDDVEEDDMLPVTKAELATSWKRRQGRLVKNLAREG